MDWFINVIILLSVLAMAIIPLYKDVIKNGKKNFFERITGTGYFLFALALIIIFFSLWKEARDSNEKKITEFKTNKRHADDSTRMALLVSKLDSLGYNLNSNVKESKPLIQLHVDHNVHSPVVLL